jgi:hypothetical protein
MREPISFRAVIPPGTTKEFEEMVKSPGTLEEIAVRFYIGQQKSLHIQPMIIHNGNVVDNVITYPDGTDKFLSGDDDYFIFRPVIPCKYDDKIKVIATNTDPVNSYTLSIDFMVDYFGGDKRVI